MNDPYDKQHKSQLREVFKGSALDAAARLIVLSVEGLTMEEAAGWVKDHKVTFLTPYLLEEARRHFHDQASYIPTEA